VSPCDGVLFTKVGSLAICQPYTRNLPGQSALHLQRNKIEHRLCSFITKNWRGKPLATHQVIVNLIAATTTTGLAVRSRIDDRIYPKGRKVSDKQLALVNLEPHDFHGEWNYTIHPTAASPRDLVI
jgi:Rhodopirellula transposase DDE domain